MTVWIEAWCIGQFELCGPEAANIHSVTQFSKLPGCPIKHTYLKNNAMWNIPL